MKVLVLNGPNLNLLGTREPEIYGRDDLEGIQAYIESSFPQGSFEMLWRQSNSESDLIAWVQGAGKENYEAIIINPAGLTHTSVSLYDALKIFEGVKLEVHLSNTYRREEFRRQRITTGASDGIIEGLGKQSYKLAFHYLFDLIES